MCCEMYSLCSKLYTNYTQTNGKLYTKPNTATMHKTLHSNDTFCFWTRIKTKWANDCWTRIRRMERMYCRLWWCASRHLLLPFCFSFEACISHDSHAGTTHESIHEHSWRKSWRSSTEKNQQFWAFFWRFDINIFNLREHYLPPNFTNSAHNFALPSSN